MWFGSSKPSNAQTAAPRGQSSAPAQKSSLEMPTTISARGIAPVKGIIEHLTATQCRLRAVVLLDRSEVLEFDVNLPGQPPLTARGRVTSCTAKPPRFVYTVSLEVMAPRKADELARSLAASHRVQMSRLRDVPTVDDLPTTDGLTRKRPRQPTEFPVQYRTPTEWGRGGIITDISIDGMRMVCRDALVEGEPLELRFTLPSEVLDVFPEETAVLDVRPSQPRRAAPSRLRKPFVEMVVRARVIHHKPNGDGKYAFGLEFCGLDRFVREEIARYVEAFKQALPREQTRAS